MKQSKTLTLTSNQAAYLDQNGKVGVVVPMVPQPDRRETEFRETEKGWFGVCPYNPLTDGPTRGPYFQAPYTVGERVEVYICNEPGLIGSIFLTVATCEPLEIAKITEEQIYELGYEYDPNIHKQLTNSDHTYGWLVVLKKGGA